MFVPTELVEPDPLARACDLGWSWSLGEADGTGAFGPQRSPPVSLHTQPVVLRARGERDGLDVPEGGGAHHVIERGAADRGDQPDAVSGRPDDPIDGVGRRRDEVDVGGRLVPLLGAIASAIPGEPSANCWIGLVDCREVCCTLPDSSTVQIVVWVGSGATPMASAGTPNVDTARSVEVLITVTLAAVVVPSRTYSVTPSAPNASARTGAPIATVPVTEAELPFKSSTAPVVAVPRPSASSPVEDWATAWALELTPTDCSDFFVLRSTSVKVLTAEFPLRTQVVPFGWTWAAEMAPLGKGTIAATSLAWCGMLVLVVGGAALGAPSHPARVMPTPMARTAPSTIAPVARLGRGAPGELVPGREKRRTRITVRRCPTGSRGALPGVATKTKGQHQAGHHEHPAQDRLGDDRHPRDRAGRASDGGRGRGRTRGQ